MPWIYIIMLIVLGAFGAFYMTAWVCFTRALKRKIKQQDRRKRQTHFQSDPELDAVMLSPLYDEVFGQGEN